MGGGRTRWTKTIALANALARDKQTKKSVPCNFIIIIFFSLKIADERRNLPDRNSIGSADGRLWQYTLSGKTFSRVASVHDRQQYSFRLCAGERFAGPVR